MCFHVSRYFELKSTLTIEKIFAHLISTISQKKKKISSFQQFTHQENSLY